MSVQFINFFLGLLLITTVADEVTHKYHNFDAVPLWVNKIGPFRNPQETYEYYSIPFCKPDTWNEKSETLGEALSGFELVESKMKIVFKENVEKASLCSVELSTKDSETFTHAIANQYWFEFFLDDLPIWGWIGEVTDEKHYLYTSHDITIAYNGDQIVEVKLDENDPVEVVPGAKFSFYYSVKWEPTTDDYEERFDKYLDSQFFEHQIHWFSIFNSFMMVIFLVALVSMILMRALKKDVARFNKDPDDYEDPAFAIGEESGWKQVSGDVFRQPPHLSLFSALIGSGTQLMLLVFLILAMSILFYHSHPFYRHGTIVTIFVAMYALTSFVGGYVSGSYYKKNSGEEKDWVFCMALTAGIFPMFLFAISFTLNFIALSYGSLAHIPFGTMLVIFLLWLFVVLPLTLCGTLVGRNIGNDKRSAPWITPYPKTIPTKRAYQKPWVHAILGGVLPFGSIFIEMYFVFTAFWQSKYYHVFGFLFMVYIILIIVCVCSTIISTYFLLNSEDYRWQWMSFASGASTAIYAYIYAIYYFLHRTKMTGFFQICFYFGYMAMFCFGLALLTGAVGFLGTQMFVKKIFNYIHVD